MAEEHRIGPGTGDRDVRSTDRNPVDFDQLFELLSRRRRRYALYYCHETPESLVTTDRIADEIAALERRRGGSEPPADEIKLTLQHAHLPKLDAASVLDHDPDAGIVEYRGGRRIDEWIDLAVEAELGDDSPWID